MTNMLTDTDLTVIEHLDFEPGCEFPGCVNEADVIANEVTKPCGCEFTALICQRHLDACMKEIAEVAEWNCGYCGNPMGYGLGSTFIHYDIEPLR